MESHPRIRCFEIISLQKCWSENMFGWCFVSECDFRMVKWVCGIKRESEFDTVKIETVTIYNHRNDWVLLSNTVIWLEISIGWHKMNTVTSLSLVCLLFFATTMCLWDIIGWFGWKVCVCVCISILPCLLHLVKRKCFCLRLLPLTFFALFILFSLSLFACFFHSSILSLIRFTC